MERRQAGQDLRHSNKIIVLRPGMKLVDEKKDYTPQLIIAIGAILSALIASRRRD